MLRWYDSISPWRIQSNVQRKLGSVDNREWTNSLLLDYLPIKPMHIQRMFILWIVITIIHSNKFFCLQNSVLPDNHGSQMGVILQSVRDYQCYTIHLYSFAVVVEYH